MKDWKKIIRENRFQFFFFITMFALLIVTLIISSNIDPVEETPSNNDEPGTTIKPVFPEDSDVVEIVEESFVKPIKDTDFTVVRKFFEKDDTKENQQLALIKFNNTYRTSQGTGYAKKDGTNFDVVAAMSGEVVEVKHSPVFGYCVVIEHDDNFTTYYYGLSEVTVKEDTEVNQGDKIGVSGYTEYDKEAKNHVYFQVKKNQKYLNPEKVIGKKTSEL